MEELVELLIKKGQTISTMESCTGGGIANAITNIPNASKVIKFSAITYSNEFKEKMGVSKNVINQYSVYSIEVAKEMAKNISIFSDSTYGVGVTGKLKKVDENNLSGEDDVVFLSIYDRENDDYYNSEIKVHYDTREDNKNEVIDVFIERILEIIKQYNK